MNTLFGLRIVTHPMLEGFRVSNFKLNPDVPLSDEFRAKMQAWCDGFFGTSEVSLLFDPRACGMSGEPMLAISPKHAVMLRTLTENSER